MDKKLKEMLVVFCLLLSTFSVWSQSVELVPGSISPNSYNLLVYTAGEALPDLRTNYTEQYVKYLWPSRRSGILAVGISNLPDGFKMTVSASPSSNGGTSIGTVNILDDGYYHPIVNSIPQSSNYVTSTLTQNIIIDKDNFSNLKAGDYRLITVYYYLYSQNWW
jgi:hypothetical protein